MKRTLTSLGRLLRLIIHRIVARLQQKRHSSLSLRTWAIDSNSNTTVAVLQPMVGGISSTRFRRRRSSGPSSSGGRFRKADSAEAMLLPSGLSRRNVGLQRPATGRNQRMSSSDSSLRVAMNAACSAVGCSGETTSTSSFASNSRANRLATWCAVSKAGASL